jgi:hypothetical protein
LLVFQFFSKNIKPDLPGQSVKSMNHFMWPVWCRWAKGTFMLKKQCGWFVFQGWLPMVFRHLGRGSFSGKQKGRLKTIETAFWKNKLFRGN